MKLDRPEHELLRLCVRKRLAPTDDAQLVRLLRGRLNWPYLLHLGHRHHVLPLLHESVVTVGEGRDVPAASKALALRAQMVDARNRRFAQELVRLHRATLANGIRMLSFKGPVLATTMYGALGRRQFEDLDVLVDEGSFASAGRCFTALGYRETRDYGYEVTLVNESTGISIDLHHTLSPDNFPVSLTFRRLWERRAMVGLEGGDVATFSTVDLLLAVCIEAVKDARLGKITLGKISDVAHVTRAASEAEWRQVESEARRLGVQRVLHFGIALAVDVFELPPSCRRGLTASSPRVGRFLREAEEGLFAAAPRSSTALQSELLHFHVRERWRDKLRPYVLSVARLITPNVHDRRVVALPRVLSPLYYLVRVARLTHRYGARMRRQRIER